MSIIISLGGGSVTAVRGAIMPLLANTPAIGHTHQPPQQLIDPAISPASSVDLLAEAAASPETGSLAEIEQRGRDLYSQGQFLAAIAHWSPLVQSHAAADNALAEASTLSNLALAYQQLGQWEKAQRAIAQSQALLASVQRAPEAVSSGEQQDRWQANKWQVTAQVFMAQGSLQIALGQGEQALDSWVEADEAYQNSGDQTGQWRARINQSQALRELGFYQQAQEQLNRLIEEIDDQPASRLQAILLRRLGNTLKLTSSLSTAEKALSRSLAIAREYNSPTDISTTLLSLGHLARLQGNPADADDFYKEAIASLKNPSASQRVPIELAQLSLWVETANWPAVAKVWPALQSHFTELTPSRSTVYHQVSWASSLIKANQALHQALGHTASTAQNEQALSVTTEPIDWLIIARQLQQAAQQAQALSDTRAESYAVGTLGQVYEQTQQWAIAQTQTQKALVLSQGAPDLAYQWQWQLGRLLNASGNPQQSSSKSIEAYESAIDFLTELRGDLSVGTGSALSFKDFVEPIYRDLVSLLLQTDQQSPDYQQNLASAQDVIESLRLAELDNYFKEACIDTQPVDINQIDQTAAVVYSIVLDDRLSVILRLPGQPLQQFSTAVTARDLSRVTRTLRNQLVIRSRREYFEPAHQLYDWLVSPIREALEASNISTIVFVLDGPLQNIPMAALYDGDRFLIEDYSVALTPGLKLLNPQPLANEQLTALVAGLTESRQGLSALPHVAQEVENIKASLSGNTVLLDEDFTRQALPEKLQKNRYPIVHIATHGQFGSSPEETYLVAWDEPIKVQEVSQILQANLGDREALELLVLSACETASGDQRAALGLSGIAVKAGARSTLGTLWAINDEATSRFIGYFYEQLTQPGATRASALRNAQLQLLNDPQYRHPIYWAPYILLGSWL
ncbi:MAG: CHAT domain-containing protein [Cyanobacteria bacterium J06598_3]